MLSRLARAASPLLRASVSVRLVSSRSAVYEKYGDPVSTVKVKETTVGEPANHQVLVKLLAAPINPADLNQIQGTYGSSVVLPAVGGSEGVGVVEKVGSGVKHLKVGDHVIPAKPSFGTWRTYALASETDLTTVPKDLSVEHAATLAVNPATAYRLLNDFVALKPGDVIIQNGANSTVGQAVIQLAHLRGIKTINVIRNFSATEETIEGLKQLGGDIVVTEEYLRTPSFKRLTSDLPPPSLALNCVGGRSATDLARTLSDGGKLVTIGGMSKKPIQIPTSVFIFKNISLHGFWLSKWVEQHSAKERDEMLSSLATLARDGKLSLWLERHKFSQFDAALAAATSPLPHRKVLLQLDA